MNIHIYTDIDTLFGRACRLWMDVLLSAGHEVEFIDLGTDTGKPLPDVGACDLNLLVTGIFAMQRFGKVGLPKSGKHLLWMFDPLTRDAEASMHHYKTGLFDALAPQLDAVMAMDASIEAYIGAHFPTLTFHRLPYLIASKHILPPKPEAARTRGVVMLGNESPRRREVEQLFLQDADAAQPEFFWAGLWGAARDTCRAESRINLNIHADHRHTYFDQFRTFEAWALGTPVVADTFSDAEAADFGITPGVHLAMASPQDMPATCAALLADAAARERMATAAQALLRERFTPQAWQGRMLAMVGQLSP